MTRLWFIWNYIELSSLRTVQLLGNHSVGYTHWIYKGNNYCKTAWRRRLFYFEVVFVFILKIKFPTRLFRLKMDIHLDKNMKFGNTARVILFFFVFIGSLFCGELGREHPFCWQRNQITNMLPLFLISYEYRLTFNCSKK